MSHESEDGTPSSLEQSPMSFVLLYAPDVVGHPRVYCRVIADSLASADCDVVVALGFTDEVGLSESPDIHPLVTRPRVRVIDTRTYSVDGDPHLKAEELVRLQRKFGIDTTLFIEADKSEMEFRRISSGGAPSLLGRNLGIFSKTAEWYPGEDSFTGARRGILAPKLRTTLGNIKRALLERQKTTRYFYEEVIIGAKVLDEIIVKDERLAAWFGPPVYWMPEISRPTPAQETHAESQEFLRREREIKEFLAANQSREPVLYFGDAAFYKGYDLLLKFVASTPATCAIHAGQTYDLQQRGFFKYDVEALRAQLKLEGRLYETNAYVHTERLKQLYFGAVSLYITTHRLALSSSTVVQALELGKPVLVPDRGLLGHRVRLNGLGDVYEYEDLADLARKAEMLWGSDLKRFAAPALSFWQRFSDESIRVFFTERLLGLSARPS
jgi:glycosyltransferase involved in cell wall biosynthesis